jgi:type II secretory pathway pseudopilin PulG
LGTGAVDRGKAGFTLIEVVVTASLTVLMCMGLYASSFKARQTAEHNRLATEARALAKESMEELISVGCDALAQPTCMLLNSVTNQSSQKRVLVTQPRIVWHAADGSVATATNAAYAEVHVDITYMSPMVRGMVTDTYSTLVE